MVFEQPGMGRLEEFEFSFLFLERQLGVVDDGIDECDERRLGGRRLLTRVLFGRHTRAVRWLYNKQTLQQLIDGIS